jgi:hypothetical protein
LDEAITRVEIYRFRAANRRLFFNQIFMFDMSDNKLSPEVELALLRAKLDSTANSGQAITFQGINKYWPQLVGAAACVWFLMGVAKDGHAMASRVALLERSVQGLTDEKVDKKEFAAFAAKQDKQAEQLERVATAVNALQSGMNSIMQDIRSNQMRGGR